MVEGRRVARPDHLAPGRCTMSTAQVQRLEGLLQRVQHNRNAPRSSSSSANASTVVAPTLPTSPAVARMELDEPAFEAPKPKSVAAPVPAAKPAAVAAAPAVSLKPAPVAAPKVVAQPAAKPAEVAVARSIPVATPAVDPNLPARVLTSPAPPSAPIAQAVSPHPSADSPSFGELLRRSLALRPR
jgi:hypothetical protein